MTDISDNNTILKSSEEWLKEPEFNKYEIIKFDGWKGKSLSEKITKQEFKQRFQMSSIAPKGTFSK